MKKTRQFINLVLIISNFFFSCKKAVSSEDISTQNTNENIQENVNSSIENTPPNTPIETGASTDTITEVDPLISSDKYHSGYEKRKISNLYPFQPIIRKNLPRIHISTNDNNEFAINSKNIAKTDLSYTPCTVSIDNCGLEYQINNVEASVRARGNFTFKQVKKPFNLNFNSKIGLLGLNNGNKFKKWALNALACDFSNLHDATAFYLGKQLFNRNKLYTSDYTFVELYINGVYWGAYLLQERQQVNKNRVNIDDVEKRVPEGAYEGTDIGYFFELGPNANEGPLKNFQINYNNKPPLKFYNKNTATLINYKDYTIHSDVYYEHQRDFLANYLNNVYTLMYEAVYNKKYFKFNDDYTELIELSGTNSYDVINEAINLDSFVDMYILQEIFHDYDYSSSSKFFQVDFSYRGDKKLAWTAIWDNDNSFGNHSDYDGAGTSWENNVGLLMGNPNGLKSAKCPWHLILIHEKWFMDLIKTRWSQLIKNGVLYNSLHYIDEFKITFMNYFDKDWDKWHDYLLETTLFSTERNKTVISNSYLNAKNYEDAANFMFKWTAQRYNSLNNWFGDGTQLFSY